MQFFLQILKVEFKSFRMMYHLSFLDIKHGIYSVFWFSSTPAGIGLRDSISFLSDLLWMGQDFQFYNCTPNRCVWSSKSDACFSFRKPIVFICGFFTKLTCAFLRSEKWIIFTELNTFYARKTTLWRNFSCYWSDNEFQGTIVNRAFTQNDKFESLR